MRFCAPSHADSSTTARAGSMSGPVAVPNGTNSGARGGGSGGASAAGGAASSTSFAEARSPLSCDGGAALQANSQSGIAELARRTDERCQGFEVGKGCEASNTASQRSMRACGTDFAVDSLDPRATLRSIPPPQDLLAILAPHTLC